MSSVRSNRISAAGRLAAITAMVLAAACGGGSTPTAPTPQPFNQTIGGSVVGLGYVQHSLNVPRSGNMTVTLSWNTTADLDLYLTTASCNTYPPGSCSLLATSDNGTTTERITRTVTAGEAFKLWVDSFSASSQNYTIVTTI